MKQAALVVCAILEAFGQIVMIVVTFVVAGELIGWWNVL